MYTLCPSRQILCADVELEMKQKTLPVLLFNISITKMDKARSCFTSPPVEGVLFFRKICWDVESYKSPEVNGIYPIFTQQELDVLMAHSLKLFGESLRLNGRKLQLFLFPNLARLYNSSTQNYGKTTRQIH